MTCIVVDKSTDHANPGSIFGDSAHAQRYSKKQAWRLYTDHFIRSALAICAFFLYNWTHCISLKMYVRTLTSRFVPMDVSYSGSDVSYPLSNSSYPTLVRHKVLLHKCTNVPSGLINVTGITASTCEFINDTRTETLRHRNFHARTRFWAEWASPHICRIGIRSYAVIGDLSRLMLSRIFHDSRFYCLELEELWKFKYTTVEHLQEGPQFFFGDAWMGIFALREAWMRSYIFRDS